jgi:phosphatidylserine/phosphatidylglycerophosphate/cardiolipin synthase-like enzyme
MRRRTFYSGIGFIVFLGIAWAQLQSITVISESGKKTALDNSSQSATVLYAIVPPQPVQLFIEPEASTTPILSAITNASTSIDLVMYELTDIDIEKALAAAVGRGISVRVLLDDGLYGNGSSTNQGAYDYLHAHGVLVKWTPSYFALTHQKTLIIDQKEAFIMTDNLTPKYYPTGRDFIIADPDERDVAAIESTFDNDWQGTQATPQPGDDLVWSPGSKETLLAMIAASKTSLQVYNEEIQDQDIVDALAAACGRGVSVQLIMTDSTQWHNAFSEIKNAGGTVRIFSPTAPLYIHAKMIIADGTQAFIGSENFSTNSLEHNRELGLFVSTPNIITQLSSTFSSDWQEATPF